MKFWHFLTRPVPRGIKMLDMDETVDDSDRQESQRELAAARRRAEINANRLRAIEFEQSLVRRKRARLPE